MHLDPKAIVAQAAMVIFTNNVRKIEVIDALNLLKDNQGVPLKEIEHCLFKNACTPWWVSASPAAGQAFVSRNKSFDDQLREAWKDWLQAITDYDPQHGIEDQF